MKRVFDESAFVKRTPLTPSQMARLRDSLVSGGFVPSGVPFETAVDNSLADAALG